MKISDFEVIFTSHFYYFSSKKLEVVTIARYLNAFWFFDFSLLDILPKYMTPKLMSRSLYASENLTESPAGHKHTQTNKPTDPRTSFFKRLPHKSPSDNNSLSEGMSNVVYKYHVFFQFA